MRYLLFTLGMLAALPLLAVLLLLLTTPITFVGGCYLIACLLIVGALLSSPWWLRSGLFALLGTALLLTTLSYRFLFPPSAPQLTLLTLPAQSAPRIWDRIFDEQDVVLFGARLAPYVHFISPHESDGLVPALAEAYRGLQGVTPLSPFALTYLNQQRPDAFDALIAQPATATVPRRAILFLHGYGGNFTLQCWLVAHAAEQIGALTICPSTGPAGDWWSPPGAAIVQQTVRYLHQRGVERIYLAGLSNGGIGASRLAQRYQSELAGLILISGADPNAVITRLPVLLVQGKDDERIGTDMVEHYLAKVGPSARYVLLEGDHFVLLKQAARVQAAITDWILDQEAVELIWGADQLGGGAMLRNALRVARARNGDHVLALGQQPCERDLGHRGAS